MNVIEHKIVQSINITPKAEITERTELEKRLLALKIAINTELASRGLAIMDLAYHPEKNIYHYSVPTSYKSEDYPIIREVAERHCSN